LWPCLAEQGYDVREEPPSPNRPDLPGAESLVLEAVLGYRPDLLLVEAENGPAVCECLKAREETELIPVVFLLPDDPAEGLDGKALSDAFERGAADVIQPSRMADGEILARIKAAIRNQRATTQAVTLARQLDRMNAELYERNLQVEKELYVARQLQQSLLPSFLPDRDGAADSSEMAADATGDNLAKCHYRDERLRISGVYLPCDALGGDLYDVIPFPDGTIGISIADVSGHGVPAGFITAIYKSSLYRISYTHDAPDELLFHLNNELTELVKTGDYITALYARLQRDGDGITLHYSGAGHPYPLAYCARDNSLTRLQENGTPLVWVRNMAYPLGRLRLQPGDKVLLFTDGLTEMRNDQGGLYGEETLERIFPELVRRHPDNVLDALVRHLSDFTGGHPLEDDLSIVLVEMN
jgi:sigma-B regulation protein RsbU (phosphoserine phosphatase)